MMKGSRMNLVFDLEVLYKDADFQINNYDKKENL